EEKIKNLNLENKVLLAGMQKDMQAWYSLFDLFLFPSVFEGLSVALLEAQANGIPIVSSDRVSPDEIKINPNVKFISLYNDKEYWRKEIVNYSNHNRISSREVENNFRKQGYEITNAAKKVERMLLQ